MLSWCGAVDGGAAGTGFGVLITCLLLNDAGIVQAACSPTAFRKELMQVGQCRHRNARRAELHAGANDRVEHPRRDDRYDAGSCLNVDHSTTAALLAAAKLDMTPVQWMPTVMDFHFMPDMGRMTG